MTAIVSDYAEAVALPKTTPRKKHVPQHHLHCIRCGLVVGEDIQLKGEIEREDYTDTDDGPVCKHCMADLTTEPRVKAATVQDKRRETFRRQVRNSTETGRDVRDTAILRMLDEEGLTYTEIGRRIGMSRQGVWGAARRMRKKLAARA